MPVDELTAARAEVKALRKQLAEFGAGEDTTTMTRKSFAEVLQALADVKKEFEAYKVNYEYNAVDLDMAVECEVKERDAARKELAEAKAALEAAKARIAELELREKVALGAHKIEWERAERAEAECEVWKEEVEYSAKNPVIRFLNERARAERAEARIAELEKALGIVLADRHASALDAEGETVRAERAEARIAELERERDLGVDAKSIT